MLRRRARARGHPVPVGRLDALQRHRVPAHARRRSIRPRAPADAAAHARADVGALDITDPHLGASTRTHGEAYAAADAAAVGDADAPADAPASTPAPSPFARPPDGRARPETDRRAGARAHAAAFDARAHAGAHTKALSGTFTEANAQTHAEPDAQPADYVRSRTASSAGGVEVEPADPGELKLMLTTVADGFDAPCARSYDGRPGRQRPRGPARSRAASRESHDGRVPERAGRR